MLFKKPDPNRKKEPINGKAVMNSWLFLLVCLVAEMIYKYARDDKSCVVELVLIMVACAVMGISNALMEKKYVPKGRDGKPLPCGDSREEIKIRRGKYIYDSVKISVACAVVIGLFVGVGADHYGLAFEQLIFKGAVSKWAAAGICAAAILVVVFVAAYLLISSSGEYRVRTYGGKDDPQTADAAETYTAEDITEEETTGGE